MELAWIILLFLVGIVFIVKGGDYFVDAASWIAEVSGIPKLIIGATIVSLATTLPEMLVSVMAAAKGSVDMAIGNAVGSVTANIGLIMAISLICMPAVIKRKDYLLKSILMLAAAALIVVSGVAGETGIVICVVLICIFAVFLWENVSSAKRAMKEGQGEEKRSGKLEKKEILINIAKFAVGAVGIVWGADLLVNNGSELARFIGISERVIGVTIVAVGTSLPELVTAVTSLMKGHGSLSLGNVVGANLFNLVLVSGVSVTLSPFQAPQNASIGGMNASLVLDLPVMFLVMLLLTVPALLRGKLSRVQGILLLAIYAGFCAVQFSL